MAAYDPKRPRRPAGGDGEPAPVDALIDLAESSASKPAASPSTSSRAEGGRATDVTAAMPPRVEGPIAPPAPSAQTPVDDATRVVRSAVVLAVLALIVLVILRRRRSRG